MVLIICSDIFRETPVQKNRTESNKNLYSHKKISKVGGVYFSPISILGKILSCHLCCSQYSTLMAATPPILSSCLPANSQPKNYPQTTVTWLRASRCWTHFLNQHNKKPGVKQAHLEPGGVGGRGKTGHILQLTILYLLLIWQKGGNCIKILMNSKLNDI